MNAKKLISIFITTVMIVTSCYSAVMADTAEEGQTCTTESGISIKVPSGFEGWWNGMADDDPSLKKHGIDRNAINYTYKETGMSLSVADGEADASYRESYEWFHVAVYETEAPSENTSSAINAMFANNIRQSYPECFETTDQFGYGSAVINGIPLYGIFYQTSGTSTDPETVTGIRVYQYSFITDDSKMYQIDIILAKELFEGKDMPFSDKAVKYLDYLAGYVVNSLNLSDDLSSRLVSIDAEPFKMAAGDYDAQINGASSGNASADAGKTCNTSSGLTVTLPSEFNPLWAGMPEDDPYLKELGVDMSLVDKNYEIIGMALQAGDGKCDPEYCGENEWFQVMIFETDAPSDASSAAINGTFTNNIKQMYSGCFGTTEQFGYGTAEVNGIPLYCVFSQTHGEGEFTDMAVCLRLYQYSFVSGSTLYQINIVLSAHPSDGKILPLSDKACKHLDNLAAYVIGSLKLSDELSSKLVSIDSEPFKMESGDYNPVIGSSSGAVSDDSTYYTCANGMSLAIPYEIGPVFWTGIAEDDPALAEIGISKSDVTALYENVGIMLQGYTRGVKDDDRECYFVMAFEEDAPAELTDTNLNEGFADKIKTLYPSCFNETQQFGYGTVEVNGIPLYKTFLQTSGEFTIRFYQYHLITNDGKMYKTNIMLVYDGEEAFTNEDPDCEHLDRLANRVINSLKLSDELSDKVVNPGTDAFKMVTGDYNADIENKTFNTAASTDENNTASTDVTPKPAANQSVYKSFISFEFPLVIILIALALLLFAGIKFSKIKEWQEEPLALDKAKAIQGFAAVAIIIHHLSQQLVERAGPVGFFEELGVLFVGIFFFFSGYGLYTSLKTKENYLKGFLGKRLVAVLIPFYVCNTVFVINSCLTGASYKPLQLLYVLSGWSLLNDHMWYVIEIVILYIAFFIFYRFIKNRTVATVAMSVFVLVMMAGSLMLCHGSDFSCSYWFMGEWWYNSSFLFIIGIIFSRHIEGLRKIARKIYFILLPVFAALTVLLGLQTRYALKTWSYWSEIPGEDPAYLDKIRCLAIQLPWIIVFVCFVLLLMMKLKFGNPVLKFLGTISLELYLIHNLFLTGLTGKIAQIPSAGMYIVLTILLSVGFATVLSGFDKYLIALISGKKKAVALPGEEIRQIHSIDVMRIVMAFLVVAIHFPFQGKAGEVFITYGKTAVPFFLVACGYFLYRDDGKEMMKRLLKQTKRILIFFLASNVFYFIVHAIYLRVNEGSFNGIKECFTPKAITDFLLYNFPPYSEHLWFFGSLLYALLIMLLLNKLKVLKYAMFAAPVLVAAYVVLSHLGIGESYQLRNAVLVGLSYTMMGMLIRRFEKKIMNFKFIAPALWILFLVCSTTAIFELNGYSQGTAVPFVSCEILTYVIFLLCLKYPNFGKGSFAEKLGHECSLPVYILHIAVMLGLMLLIPGTPGFISTYGAVTVFVVTTAIAALYENIKHAVKETKQK